MNPCKLDLTDSERKELKLEYEYYSQFGIEIRKLDKMPLGESEMKENRENRANRVMLADSYKYTHVKQYPKNIVGMYDYAEARSGKIYEKTLFFGLQYILKRYFTAPITLNEVQEASFYADQHGIDFDLDGWVYIVTELGGKLPVEIRAIPEGKVIPVKNVLFTIESTDPKVFWIASWMETILMKVWYTSNIATRSYYVRKMLEEFANETQDEPNTSFQFHNFGDRGSSSVESASIGGVAHLAAGFMGTDNFNCISYADQYYCSNDQVVAGYSIPATEHSSTTSWGQENELEMIMNHLENNKGKPIIAAVCDSYDYFKTIDAITKQDSEFQKKINSDEYPIFVIRPDSGDPVQVLNRTLDIMESNKVPFTVNKKGFKVWNKMRIIWGDGINDTTIHQILSLFKFYKYSSENISFGSGGWLMQQHDRDTQGWAVKCSNVDILNEDGSIEQRDVFKNPVTASNKISKKGKITTFYNKNTKEYFVDQVNLEFDAAIDILETVYKNGELVKSYSLNEIRVNNA